MGAYALVVGVWTVLVALFAMHGLPMQSPGAMTMAAPSTATAAAAAMPQMHDHAAAPADAGLASPAATGGAQTASDSSQACGGGDHCTATLRAADAAAVPAVIGVVSRTTDTADDAAPPSSQLLSAQPPDLDTLQISRT